MTLIAIEGITPGGATPAVVTVVVALIGAAGGAYAARVARAATRETQRLAGEQETHRARIEAEASAYERARRTYESMLGSLREQLDRVQLQLDRVRDILESEQDNGIKLRRTIADLETQLAKAEQVIARQQRELEALKFGVDLRRET